MIRSNGRAAKKLVLLCGAILTATLMFTSGALANKGEDLIKQGAKERAIDPSGWNKFVHGWEEFSNVYLLLETVISIAVAMVLGGLIAYHPRSYGRASALEEIEHPKTFIMYTLVGCVIGMTASHFPEMALVFFGIGSFFRFRTDAGPAKNTGRVILVTVIGLCTGAAFFVPAVITTIAGWIIIYVLDSSVVHRLTIKGVDNASLIEAAGAYQQSLESKGIKVMSQRKNFQKSQVSFVLRAGADFDRDELEESFKSIPPKLQGAADWEAT